MYSLSKTPVSAASAQDIVTHHLGSNARVQSFSELTDGYFNAAYRVELADGLVFVLKVAPPVAVRVLRYERDIMRTEVDVLRLAREKTTMPVPGVLFADDSRRLIANPFFAMEFLPGTPFNKIKEEMPPDHRQAVEHAAGRYLRQMNGIGGPRFGLFAHSNRQSPRWREAFGWLMDDILADGAEMSVVLPLPPDRLTAGLASHYAVLDEVASPCLVHWDLWDGNIFVDPITHAITGVIDFERALWADPLMECNFGAFGGVSAAFAEGYGRPMLQSESQQRRRALYNVYLYLIMIIECYYRRYETDKQETWARGQLDRELRGLGLLPAA
jgi:aminoglycoside phosphotransferase (APT) family kinase protein